MQKSSIDKNKKFHAHSAQNAILQAFTKTKGLFPIAGNIQAIKSKTGSHPSQGHQAVMHAFLLMQSIPTFIKKGFYPSPFLMHHSRIKHK